MTAVVVTKGQDGKLDEAILNRLSYNHETGLITWKVLIRCGRGRILANAGDEAGTIRKDGYRAINLLGRPWLSHRIAWFLFYGVWPSGHVDHMNGSRIDNRIANLRDVSRAENLQNMKKATASKKHGCLIGSAWHRQTGKWRAVIRINGRQKSLGYFYTEQEAHAAYVKAKRQFHPGGLL